VINETMRDAESKMDKAVEVTREEFAAIRAGRANPSMFAKLTAEYYGTPTPLQQLASFTAPEARIILVQPYDVTAMPAIEKAIRESDLGLDPSSQGGVIRVPLPSMNEQRRKDLVKIVHKLAEDGRVAVRHARGEARDRIKKVEGVSEDDKKHAEKDLQKVHDDYMSKIDALVKGKEVEIMEV
jgi:ribosome recycling factor